MTSPIVQTRSNVTLVGAGAIEKRDFATALHHAPVLVAADGGAQTALDHGHEPVAVIGDFDSLSETTRAQIPQDRLFPIREQNSTDFDKALRNTEAPLVVAVGFLGGRVDHQLAALNTLVNHTSKPCVLLGPSEVIFHAPPRVALDLQMGDVVSLFPMTRISGRSQGLEWPIDGLTLAPDGRVGTSNRATGAIQLETDGAGLLVILPRGALGAVIRALAAAPLPAPMLGPGPVREE